MDAPGPEGRGGAPRRKRFGQHFLTDPGLLARIAEASGAAPGISVVEIGPGRGALTEHLLQAGATVTAVEIDRDLVRQLRARFAGDDRLTIVEGDVLQQDLAALGGAGYVLAGNLPYNITTPILFHALRAPRPSRAVFLLQREVGDRMGAAPGSDAYGALSVNLAALARTEVLFRVPPGAFQPPPKVDSVVVRVTPRPDQLVRQQEEAPFRTLVQGAFGLRRKQMRRVVRILFDLDAAAADTLLASSAIAPDARPETLDPEAFVRLLAASTKLGTTHGERRDL